MAALFPFSAPFASPRDSEVAAQFRQNYAYMQGGSPRFPPGMWNLGTNRSFPGIMQGSDMQQLQQEGSYVAMMQSMYPGMMGGGYPRHLGLAGLPRPLNNRKEGGGDGGGSEGGYSAQYSYFAPSMQQQHPGGADRGHLAMPGPPSSDDRDRISTTRSTQSAQRYWGPSRLEPGGEFDPAEGSPLLRGGLSVAYPPPVSGGRIVGTKRSNPETAEESAAKRSRPAPLETTQLRFSSPHDASTLGGSFAPTWSSSGITPPLSVYTQEGSAVTLASLESAGDTPASTGALPPSVNTQAEGERSEDARAAAVDTALTRLFKYIEHTPVQQREALRGMASSLHELLRDGLPRAVDGDMASTPQHAQILASLRMGAAGGGSTNAGSSGNNRTKILQLVDYMEMEATAQGDTQDCDPRLFRALQESLGEIRAAL
jgi:hypothetical protein